MKLASTNLDTVTYSKATQELTISFHSGAEYVYSGVEEGTYRGLTRSADPNGYFEDNIKGIFPYVQTRSWRGSKKR